MSTSHRFAVCVQRVALAALLTSGAVSAFGQVPQIYVKVIGVTYLEAPPGRDKNVAAFGTFSSMEKVEIHAVAISKNILFSEATGFLEKGNVTANAIAGDGKSIPLGTADMNSFGKVSVDRRMRSLNLSIARLPDQPIKGIVFEGQVPVYVFKKLKTVEKAVDLKAGSNVTIEKIVLNIAKLDGKSLTIKGNTDLTQIASLSVKTPDGKLNTAKLGAYSRMNSDLSQEWEFNSPASSGVIIVELFDGLQETKIPVRLVIGKPF